MKETAKKRGRPPIDEPNYNAARARKMVADAELAELELLKAKGDLVSAEDVCGAWTDVLGAARGKLLATPTKLAPLLSTETETGVIRHLIEEAIREALDELSAYKPSINAGSATVVDDGNREGVEGSKAANAPKRKRVGRPRKATVIRE